MKKLFALCAVAAVLTSTAVMASAEEVTTAVSDDTMLITEIAENTEDTTGDVDAALPEDNMAETVVEPVVDDTTVTEPIAEDTTTVENVVDTTAPVDEDKGSPDTGVEGVAAVAGVAVLAGGVLLLAGKKRN